VIYQAAPFAGRNQFAGFLNSLGLLGTAVELGTHRGVFAANLIANWKGEKLVCVDTWASGYDVADPTSHSDRTADYKAAQQILHPFRSRTEIYRKDSVAAADRFSDGTVDFVYVDACHQEEATAQDLRAWWPKLRAGGILAGHDIVCLGEKQGGWGRTVQPAVTTVAESLGIPYVYLVTEIDGAPWSYYMRKDN